MDINQIIEIIVKLLIVAVLVFMNGFFVAAEFALVKIRDTQLDILISKGNKRAKITRVVIQNLDSSLSACQLGITVASLALGWVGEPVFKVILEPVFSLLSVTKPETKETLAVVVGFISISYLHIIAGEQSAKWLAIIKPLQTSLWVSAPLRLFYFVTYPFIWILNKSALKLLELIGIEPTLAHEKGFSEEELRLLFSATQKQSGRSKLGREIVLNALDLQKRVVKEVMRPRKEIVFFDINSGIDECIEIAEKTRYSRYPLCEDGNVDKTIGVIHIKDLYSMRKSAVKAKDLVQVARKLIYVPPTCRLEKILQLFLEKKLHMAIVVDEFGGTLGLVTLENVLEELVGQIQDEFDQEKPKLVKTDTDTWELDGTLPLYELSELINNKIEAEDVSTVSGWVTQYLGGFPKPGDTIRLGEFKIEVQSTDGARVDRLKVCKEKKAEDLSVNS
ncbi:MAG: hemolysin family protein [Verrucomicrobiae bacterium]|nr:hemolysin family protein [Verrucomicrobiae bacterium]